MEQAVYKVIQIEKDCWRIEEGHVRCFLFTGYEHALLVDSGFGSGNLKEVVAGLTSLPVRLINTHADRDHVGANTQFATAAHMHPSEFARYSGGGGMPTEVKPLWERDFIDIGSYCFEVILLPGHTPGSIALLDEKRRLLISGDTLVSGADLFMFGEGRDLAAYIFSLEKLNSMQGRFDIIYPCHGDFPLGPQIIDSLLVGAKQIQTRCLTGEKISMMGREVIRYDVGVAGILFDK